MIPPRSLARMIADRSATSETMARAVVEAVMLRAAFEHVDDNLLAIEAHAEGFDDDGHQVLKTAAAELRRRIIDEVARVDHALIRSLHA